MKTNCKNYTRLINKSPVILECGLNYVIFRDNRKIVPYRTILWYNDIELGTFSSIKSHSWNLYIYYKNKKGNIEYLGDVKEFKDLITAEV